VPSDSRNGVRISAAAGHEQSRSDDDTGSSVGVINELREKALYKVKDEIAAEDIQPVMLPINSRYRLIIYADAYLAVGPLKQSVSERGTGWAQPTQ
jgi:hypothetical protein